MVWQSQWVDAPTPAGLEVVAGPFDLRVSPTLTTVDPNFDAASLSLYYVERSASGEQIDAGSLQIFAWDGQQWLAQETTAIETGKLASAPIPLRNGRFALFGRWMAESQLYLPFVQKK